jgi:outer membrane protein assembly complex protein YaeT
MSRRTVRLAVQAVATLWAFGLLAAPVRGAAQDAPPAVVSKVIVLVDSRPARGALAGLIPFKPGDPYSPAAIDRVIKQVYKMGLFSDVRVTRSGEEKVELTFSLTRNLIIRRVSFHGVKVRSSRLKEAMETLRPGSVFSEERLPKAVDELREGLRLEGYFDPQIVPSTRTDPKAPRVDLSFKITGWKRYKIRSIDMQGPIAVPPENLLKRIKTRPREFYVPSVLDRDIQALETYYTSQGYPRSDIQLAAEHFDTEKQAVALVLGIQPHEKITIVINGARVPSSLLAPIWEERVFEEWGLAEGEVRILNYLRKKGYVYAALTSRIERPENELRVVYDVVSGKKYRIEKISFEGLKSFSAQKLRDELVVSERTLFFSLLSYDRLFALPREIEYFYQANGFPDVRAELALPRTSTGVNAILKIEEGPRRTILSISIVGSHLFPPEAILKELVSVKGGAYFPPNIQRDVGIIETYYLNHGIRGTKVTSRVETAGENSFALTFDIEEGTPVIIQNILITGNRLTRMGVVEKEIQVREGEAADSSLIQETKRRLERLGVFSDVRTDEILTEPGKETLVVTVQEGEMNYAGAGIGFESRNVIPSSEPMDFGPRATAEYIRSNVFGMAAQLSLVGQYSDFERRAILSWNQPYLFGLALRPSLLGWVEREDRTSFTFVRRGVSFNLSRPLSPKLILLGTLSWSRTDLPWSQPGIEIDRRLQHYSTTLASVGVVLDKRDDTFNPEKGYFVSVVSEIAKPLLGTESDYWKTFFKVQYFKPVASQVFFSLLGRVGLAQGQLISLPERFFAGGSNSFRGEWFDFLGPKDPQAGQPEGGRALFLVNAEMRFPIIPTFKELSGAVFFDIGNVFSYLSNFRVGDLEEAAGLGIRYRTPLGPVRIELAWNIHTSPASLAPRETRKKTPYFFITIGQMF